MCDACFSPAFNRLLLLAAAALLLTLGLTACNRGPGGPFPLVAYSDDGDLLPKASGPGLVVDPQSYIPDVPKPVGFVGVPSKSSSRTDGQTRQVVHVYQGRSSAVDAAAFYRRYLDDYGWKLDGFDSGDPRATVQAYAKGPEQLRITITSAKGITTINAVINPRGEAERPALRSGNPVTPQPSVPTPAAEQSTPASE